MVFDPRTLALIKQRLEEAEHNIQYVQRALEGDEPSGGSRDARTVEESGMSEAERITGERIIEGVFDGQSMQGNDGQEYPIAPNYSSKSKLVEGDVLKLTIGVDGAFVYKQINPVERQRVVGKLIVDQQGNFGVHAAGKTYRVLLASVTFYRAEEGDEVTILVPQNSEATWGAVEHVIHAVPQQTS